MWVWELMVIPWAERLMDLAAGAQGGGDSECVGSQTHQC